MAVLDRRVFARATTPEETQRALQVAQTIATGAHCDLAIIVPSPERPTVRARAHAHEEPIDDPVAWPDPSVDMPEIRALVRALPLEPRIIVIDGFSAPHVAPLLPAGATVVICGSMNRFFESPEQRLARELSTQRFEVIFLPHASRIRTVVDPFAETELMRHILG